MKHITEILAERKETNPNFEDAFRDFYNRIAVQENPRIDLDQRPYQRILNLVSKWVFYPWLCGCCSSVNCRYTVRKGK